MNSGRSDRSRRFACLLLALASLPLFAGSGGPDASGYRWRDTVGGGPAYSWIEINATGTSLNAGDTTISSAQNLGFSFSYYGTNYTQVKVCSNGWITPLAGETSTTAANTTMPASSTPNPIIAAFWDDLDASATGNGEVYFQSFGTYAVVEFDAVRVYGTTRDKTFEFILYQDGRIVIQYKTVQTQQNGSCTVGIENAAGTVGLQCLYNGTASGGFALANSYAVEFYIAGNLVCTGATALSCDSTVTGQSMGAANNATAYSCGAGTYDGLERVYTLTLASAQNLDIVLSNFGADALDVFLLSSCNELISCLQGGADTIARDNVPAGTYYIVVDGTAAGDNGPFDLQVKCNPPSTLNCSTACDVTLLSQDFTGVTPPALPAGWTTQVVSGNAWNTVNSTSSCSGSADNILRYPYHSTQAADSWVFSSGVSLTAGTRYRVAFDQRVYSATYPENLEVKIGMSASAAGMSQALWNGSGLVNLTCSNRTAEFTASATGTYYLGFHCTSAANMWDLILDNVTLCSLVTPAWDCSSAQALTCPSSLTGSTSGGSTSFSGYSCSTDTFAGHEKIYTFTVAGATAFTATLSNFGLRDLSMFLLSSCDPCSCIAGGTSINQILAAGTYYLVVDGFTAADDGAYNLDVTCLDPCSAPPPIVCGATVSSTTVGKGDDLHDPGLTCVGGGAGPDELWRLDYAGPAGSTLWAEAVPAGGWDHTLYALSNCQDVASCSAGADNGPITVNTTVSPQTVFFAVDGWAAGSQGAYDLTLHCFSNQMSCAGAEPLSCYSSIPINTVGGAQDVSQYACAASGTHPGPEKIYQFTLPAAGTITATLSGLAGDDLDVFILNGCAPGSCQAWGETTATLNGAPAGAYTLVVDTDKYNGAGTGTLTLTCPLGNSLACGSAVPLSCDTELDADTSTGLSGQDKYTCGPKELKGKEKLYTITLGAQSYLIASLSGTGGRDLDLVLLSSCDPNACLAQGDTGITQLLNAGTYTLVVDGATTLDDGPFHLEVLCSPPSALGCNATLIDENFDGAAPPWTTELITGNLWDIYTDSLYSCSGTDFLRYPYHLTEPADSWIFTDAQTLTAGSTYTLAFNYRARSATFPESLEVWIGTAATSAGMTTKLWERLDFIVTTCTAQSIPFTVPSSGAYSIGFHAVSAADMYWITVDDVTLTGSGGSSSLDCSSPTALSCGQTLTGQTMGPADNQQEYACSPHTFSARERVFAFTLTEVRTINITLANFGSEDLALFLLSACDPCACIQGGGTTLQAYGLSPGTYYIVVEGYDASDNDATYDITLSCADPCLAIPLLACNSTVSGNTGDNTNQIDPTCGSGGAGPEELWKVFFDGPVGSVLTVTMPNPAWDHILYALGNCTDPASCLQWADSGPITLITTTSPQTYYIAVDGYTTTAMGAYSGLTLTCPIPTNLNCAAATPIACGDTLAGDTIGKPNDAEEYAGVNGTFTGSDIVYALTLAAPRNLDIYLEGIAGRNQILVLLEKDTCNVNNIVEGGVRTIHLDNAQAGTWYIVVDGRTPADNGAFTLRIVCNTPATPPDCDYLYTVTEPAAFSWIDATTGTAHVMTDDSTTGFIALPFTFDYYGASYNQIAASSNGWASFTDGTSTALTNAAIPTAAVPNALLAAFWDDLYGATLYTRTVGTTPNQRFVIEWFEFPDCCSATNPKNTFEIVLFEGSNAILFQYLTVNGDRTSSTIGIESPDGSGGYQRYFDNTPAVPALTNYAIRFDPVGPPTGLNCSGAVPVTCDSTTPGDTAGGGLANNASAYGCGIDTYDGNEQIFVLTLAQKMVVEVTLAAFGIRELDAFVLDSCSQCDCAGGGSDHFTVTLDPGTHYIVVDGFTTADNGPFTLTLACTLCADSGAHNRWTSCENVQSGGGISTSTTSAFEWNFDDCDYCRDAGNTCFSTPCTFDMYIVAECGTEMHMPLWDNETGDLKIYDLTRDQYVYLYAQSTGGWSAQGTEISWQDCGGLDDRWNDQVTDVWFTGSPTLCGIYRAEFINWGGFIWDLYSNCDGTDTPGFRIYDNYCEALAAYDPFPALSVESITISGTCPTYTVNYQISNAGCAAASTTVVVNSDLGGASEKPENNILPGETRTGSITVNIQNGGAGTIYAYADFYDSVFECQEAGDTATACSISGGTASASAPVNCGCVIPQFSTVHVEDQDCPVGLRLYWDAATFASGSGHYDVYRSTVSFADAVAQPPVAQSLAVLEYPDNAVTPGSTYYYVVRAEDAAPAVPPCTAGPHGGLYTDVNVGPITDNLTQNQDKPYDVGNDLRASRNPDGSVHLYWPTVTPHANTTHYHVYRAVDPAATFPDLWTQVAVDKPQPGYLDPATKAWDDTGAPAVAFYDIRSANDCEDICPQVLNVRFSSTSPSCDATGQMDFTAHVQGGLGPYAYDWDFGDGSPHSATPNPTHIFTYPPYGRTVTLTVTDSTIPASQVESYQAVVSAGPSVSASFTYGAAGLTVTFDGTPGGGSGGFTYRWNFGDNSSSTDADPAHTYTAPGTYTVTYTVIDAATGCQVVQSQGLTL